MAVGFALDGAIAVGSAAYRAVADAIEQRREQREEKAALIEALEQALISAHHQDFESPGPPEWHNPEPVDTRATRRAFKDDALTHLRWWQLIQRGRAKRAAYAAAEQWADKEAARRLEAENARFERARQLWPGLQNNDTDSVIEALEDAFEDNQMPALPLDCEQDGVTLAVISGTKDQLPEAVSRDERGKAKFGPRENVSELHRDSLLSNMLATSKEAFAAAPFIDHVQVIVLERRGAVLRKRDRLVPLVIHRMTRAELARIDWTMAPIQIASSVGTMLLKHDDATHEVQPLPLDDEPDVRQTATELAEALGCRT